MINSNFPFVIEFTYEKGGKNNKIIVFARGTPYSTKLKFKLKTQKNYPTTLEHPQKVKIKEKKTVGNPYVNE